MQQRLLKASQRKPTRRKHDLAPAILISLSARPTEAGLPKALFSAKQRIEIVPKDVPNL